VEGVVGGGGGATGGADDETRCSYVNHQKSEPSLFLTSLKQFFLRKEKSIELLYFIKLYLTNK